MHIINSQAYSGIGAAAVPLEEKEEVKKPAEDEVMAENESSSDKEIEEEADGSDEGRLLKW